jgi:hypothetical protein
MIWQAEAWGATLESRRLYAALAHWAAPHLPIKSSAVWCNAVPLGII